MDRDLLNEDLANVLDAICTIHRALEDVYTTDDDSEHYRVIAMKGCDEATDLLNRLIGDSHE